MKKLNPETLDGVQEVNFFKEDGKVLHFNRAAIQALTQNNTYAVYGRPQEKSLTEMLPNILPQLGEENLATLTQLAEQLNLGGLDPAAAAQLAAGKAPEGEEADIPDLVAGENFEDQVE